MVTFVTYVHWQFLRFLQEQCQERGGKAMIAGSAVTATVFQQVHGTEPFIPGDVDVFTSMECCDVEARELVKLFNKVHGYSAGVTRVREREGQQEITGREYAVKINLIVDLVVAVGGGIPLQVVFTSCSKKETAESYEAYVLGNFDLSVSRCAFLIPFRPDLVYYHSRQVKEDILHKQMHYYLKKHRQDPQMADRLEKYLRRGFALVGIVIKEGHTIRMSGAVLAKERENVVVPSIIEKEP